MPPTSYTAVMSQIQSTPVSSRPARNNDKSFAILNGTIESVSPIVEKSPVLEESEIVEKMEH